MTQNINANYNVSRQDTAKKIVKTAAVAAGAASLIYAAKNGQAPDTFEGAQKVKATLADGYKKLGNQIKDKAVNFVKSAKQIFTAKEAPVAEKASEVVSDIASHI